MSRHSRYKNWRKSKCLSCGTHAMHIDICENEIIYRCARCERVFARFYREKKEENVTKTHDQ